MEFSLSRSLIFLALATVTLVLAYLYQRRERIQRMRGIWTWPLIFTVLAARAVIAQWQDVQALVPWLAGALVLGVAIGVLRGLVFGVRPGENPGEIRLRPTIVSGAIYLAVLFFNEFEHVFRYGDPSAARISCAFLVLSAGSSIGVNVTRALRYRAQLPPESSR